MTDRAVQVILFLVWPVIACLLMFCVALICAAAWLLIPFSTPSKKDNVWTLKFPWSDK